MRDPYTRVFVAVNSSAVATSTVTDTGVETSGKLLSMAAHKGKSENFTEPQMGVLRRALNDLVSAKGSNQTSVANRFKVTQQTISRALNPRMGGIQYQLATQIALASGFNGVDHLFEFHHVRGKPANSDMDQRLRTAVFCVKALYGCPDDVIAQVIHAAGGPLAVLSTAMWGDRFRAAQLAIEAQHMPEATLVPLKLPPKR